MISSVTFEKTTWNKLPYKFEAGTPDIAGAVGLGAAIDYVDSIGLPAIAAHEHDLLEYGTAALREVPGLRLIGTAKEKAAVLSFVLGETHPHDVGTVLDREGIAIRTGHHCAQPLMRRFGVAATARASFALYNRREDVDALVLGLRKVREILGCATSSGTSTRTWSSSTARTRGTSASWKAPTGGPRASTRSAATRSPCTSSWPAR
jgi:cysteine desulfurase/selenocysteine lyase